MEANDTPGQSLADGLIKDVLSVFGWISILAGVDPLGRSLITNDTSIHSYAALVLFILAGAALVMLARMWPPNKPEVRELFTRLLWPIATRWKILAVIGAFALWAYLDWQIISLKSDFDSYVAPRLVTLQQRQVMRDYLSHETRFPVEIEVDQANAEAWNYAETIAAAFQISGWDATFTPQSDVHDALNFNGIYVKETGPGLKPFDKRDPAMILRAAFHAADVIISDGGTQPNDEPHKLAIVVGHRPLGIMKAPIGYLVADWIKRKVDQILWK